MMVLFQKYAHFIANTAYETWEKEGWSKPTIFFQLDCISSQNFQDGAVIYSRL